MAVSVASFAQVANWFTSSAKSISGLSWSSGDVIVAFGTVENAGGSLAAPTNANLTFTLQASVTTGGNNQAPAYVWTAVAGSTQTGQTVSIAVPGGNRNYGFAVWVLSGASGSFANAAANQTEAGFTFTPTAGSGVVYGFGDWNANQTDQTLATGTGTGTERVDIGDGASYGVYCGDWMSVTATSATFGVTSYSGLVVAHAVIEILAAAGGATDVTPADALHAHAADQPTLTQIHEVASQDAAHSHTTDQPALTQVHEIAADSAAHAHTADSPTLVQVHVLAADDATHGHTADEPAITSGVTLVVANALHTHTADSPTLTQTHLLVVDAAVHAHLAEQSALTQRHLTFGTATLAVPVKPLATAGTPRTPSATAATSTGPTATGG